MNIKHFKNIVFAGFVCWCLSGCGREGAEKPVETEKIASSSAQSIAADRRYAEDVFDIGKTLAERGKVAEAMPLIREAANLGHAEAQFAVGSIFADPLKKYEEAAGWYRKAAEQGYMQAQTALGQAYHFGLGVTQNYEEAIKWYGLAAKQGDKTAEVALQSLLDIKRQRLSDGSSTKSAGRNENQALKAEAGKNAERWNREGQNWISPSTGMKFVWVTAMNMWVGTFEVTNGEYRKKEPGHNSDGKYKEDYGSANSDRQPVVRIKCSDCVAYAKWMTERDRSAGNLPSGYEYRLPTVEEWITFAQCGDGRKYPWGNNWPPRSGQAGNYSGMERKLDRTLDCMIAGYSDNSIGPCAVEESWMNPWGLYGVGGNVYEYASKGDGFKDLGGSFRCNAKKLLACEDPYPEDRLSADGLEMFDYGGFRLVLCRGSSDASELKPSVTKPNSRFIDLGDGTVKDSQTGLEWVQAPHALPGNSGATNWNTAVDYCSNLDYADHSDWRLPSSRELESLVDKERYLPALPDEHPFIGVQNGYYWSGTSYADNAGCAWYVSMYHGGVYSYLKTFSGCVWPVRGGQ